MLHRSGDRTRQLLVGVLGVSLHLLARFYFSCPNASAGALNPSPDSNGTASPTEGDKIGFAFRGQETLGKNYTFFKPGVGKCVNATGLLVDTVGVKPTSRGGPCPALPSATCPYELSVALAK